MKHPATTNHKISREIPVFLIDRQARGRSNNTILFYKKELNWFLDYANILGVKHLEELEAKHIRLYFIKLYETRNEGGVSAAHRSIRAFLFWWSDEIEDDHFRKMIKKLPNPKASTTPLPGVPIADVKKMVTTCNRKKIIGQRDRALLLFMLDTGLRANEIVSLDIGDLNVETGAVHVRYGKGNQERTVFLGNRSRMEYLRYLRFRSGELSDDEPIWLSLKGDNAGKRLKYSGLRQILRRRSVNAMITTPTAHDFRRAFTITYLRNGGDVFTLRHLLGHKTLEMVMRYLAIVDIDLENAHRKASPADSM